MSHSVMFVLRNCLMDLDTTVKVSDFGLSSVIPDSTMVEGGIGALKYLAPESIMEPFVFSPKSDVFAFGVLLWEVRSNQASTAVCWQ